MSINGRIIDMKIIPWNPTYFVYRDEAGKKQLLADLTDSNPMLEPYRQLTKQIREMIAQSQQHYLEYVHEPTPEQGQE